MLGWASTPPRGRRSYVSQLPGAAASRVARRGFGVPCAECVSSLLRCCRLSDAAHHHQHHQHHQPQHRLHQHHQQQQQPAYTVHSPRPIRPYTNMLQLSEGHAPQPTLPGGLHAGAAAGGGSGGGPGAAAGGGGSGGGSGGGKRKRSWSRAVFSNLQRKGLEKRFQLQKYITKPDRRQLAATLGLTDAQVKVWFQNRRMKWRHSREAKAAAAPSAPAAVATGDAAVDSTQRDPPEGDPEAELVDVQAIDSG